MDHSTYIIYGLFEPSGELRYVGQTVKGLDHRLKKHISSLTRKGNNHRLAWLRSLAMRGEIPYIQKIQELGSKEDLNAAETYWITYFRSAGARLINSSDGGEGGVNPDASVRERIAAAHRGKPGPRLGMYTPPETRIKQREAQLGKKRSLEQRVKNAIGHGARSFVDQHGNLYRTIFEAAEALGLYKSGICNVLKGRQGAVGGYKFSYQEDRHA